MKFNDMLKKKKKEHTNMQENNEELNEQTAAEQDTTQQPAEETMQEPTAEAKLKEELAQANDKYLRLYAEFDNFRRRTTKERVELLQTAGKEIIVSLLPVLDDFERAFKSMDQATDVVAVKAGVELIHSKLNNILSQKGLKPMEAVGEPFDADLHEAITNIPAPTDDMKGKVIDQMEKGYYLGDKVVRFAKVIVGN
ncbi:nucleotide exchange factor GrpE [Mucilaginibacter roseus]|uniref:Protein GrpE n=1 Tax=Mucilaginibacter roseus TaxID=1528868 RepID=A0ABS8U026_9SPHI|nr:nucleotide exchange factor GrpE [Mucilaginibacter roseus]MCD8739440.1 nucleotide exchange factor GrpE [Mucilaginibacter roseus]